MMEFATAYGPKRKVLAPTGPGLTKQSFAQEANVNFIVQKYRATGLIEHTAAHQGQYGEFAAIDYHEAMNAIKAAEQMFASVPADLRKRFDNDPGAFVEFVNNPDNLGELRELGLALPAEPAPVVPGPAPEPAPEPAPAPAPE